MAVSISNLTSGNATSATASTASVTISSGADLLLSVAVSTASTMSGAVYTVGITGGAETWTEIGTPIVYADRRKLHVFIGTGTKTNEAIAFNIAFTSLSYQSHAWSVDQITGHDTGTPNDTAVSFSQTSASASSIAAPDVGTPDSGDAIFAAFGVEDSDANPSVTSPLVALGTQTGLGNVRHLLTGWDEGALTDETPQCAVTNSRGGVIAFIVNAGAGSSFQPAWARNSNQVIQ